MGGISRINASLLARMDYQGEKAWRPKITWQKTVEQELREMGLNVGRGEAGGQMAKDRERWKSLGCGGKYL